MHPNAREGYMRDEQTDGTDRDHTDEPGELADPGNEPPPEDGADPDEFPPLPPNRDEGTRA
jgi:hypothetical protein